MTEASIPTTVTLPGGVFWKVAEIAEHHDMRVDQYLVELAFQASLRRDPDMQDSVAVRWRKGMTDKEIARDLGWTNAQVSTRRRGLRLPPNKHTTNPKESTAA